MHASLLDTFFGISHTVIAMCVAGIVCFAVALWTAKSKVTRAGGLDKVSALGNLCMAVPLAVFGALHIWGAQLVLPAVPSFMPWRLFWAYFVGVALLAASLSMATNIMVRWSGLLFGVMMLLIVVMLEFPDALASPGDRFGWTLVIREMAFASGGWLLAASALRGEFRVKLILVGRVLIGITALFFGVEHFLHPLARPGVPLEKLMPVWIPGRSLIGYLTGALLVVAGASILANRKTRIAATYLGAWIALLVVLIYGPILFASLADPGTDAKIEGINYFADTLLFAGAILALARATSGAESAPAADGS
jgi:hypothetical protein